MKWSSSIYANGNQMPVLRCRQPMSPVAGAQRQKGAKAPPTHIERMLADARLRWSKPAHETAWFIRRAAAREHERCRS
jgi:hypothetical protein